MPGPARARQSALAAFERLLESLVERSLVAPFRGPIHPREIARRLGRAMEAGAVLEVERHLAPNDYLVHLNPSDYEPLAAARTTLEGELARYLARSGAERGYTFLALPTVRLSAEPATAAHTIDVAARIREVPSAVATPAPSTGGAPSGWELEVAGRSVPLPFGTLRLGRAPDCDVVLPSPHVSRYHAELVVDAAGARLRDLGSTNGTTVDGQPTRGEALRAGARISFGGIVATIRRPGAEAASDAARA
jgi:hypothetical protein